MDEGLACSEFSVDKYGMSEWSFPILPAQDFYDPQLAFVMFIPVVGWIVSPHPAPPQIHVNQEHQNITLFGNRVFVDVDS